MYFDNMKVMAHTNYDYYVFKELKSNERCQKTMKKIFDNKDLCMIMLEQNHNVFSLFSEKVIANMDILELYIKKSYQYDNLPAKVFLNKNILLHMLRAKPNFIEKIPAEYLDKINNGYLDYIKSQTELNVLIIDVSDRDFVKNQEDYLYILDEIQKKISQ